MTALSAKTADRADIFNASNPAGRTDAPPIAPYAHEGVIDLAHLTRMTGGDRRLEREVLDLFAMQCEVLLARMHGASPDVVGALAHTLNGSARGIGAWTVTEAAELVERTAAAAGDVVDAVAQLAAVTAETRAAIKAMARG
jgi:hypothetical protein